MKKIYSLLLFVITTVYTSSAQQNSLLFDGVDDKVTIPNNALLNSSTTITVEAWINASQWKPQVHQGTIVGKDGTNTSGYVLRCGAGGKLSWNVGTTSTWTEVSTAAIMQTNSWYHVAGVFDNGNMSIYINGNLEGTITSNPITVNTTALIIGDSPGYPGRVFQGYIDEVRVWNVARTQAEIQANDTVDLPNNEPGLVAYYKFNQTSGTTVPNEITATTNTTGTLVNFGTPVWGPGYTVGGIDLSANAILSPDRITFFSGAARVRALFKNNGTDTISNFTVGYRLNSGTPVIETITDQVPPNGELEYAFHNVVEGGQTATLKVFGSLTNDYNVLNDTVSYTLVKPTGLNNTIPLFTQVRHDFAANGQSHLSIVPLPDENTKYSQILMTISLACTPNGCDPWDQPAKISLLRDGQTYELARFITPYGIGCGPWVVDVTSFKSLLTGACNFESYIQVWGPNGWMLNAFLTYVESPTAYPYQKVTRLWETDNWVYGDPGISYDLPLQTVQTNALTQELEFRMTNSGHGQGNTQNAAEFSHMIHTVLANGTNVASHDLWKSNCGQNACANQNGTWLYSRAGWCPGQEVQPYFVNFTSQLTPGSNITVDYQLQTYTNLLNTGYNGGSHTEPHYKIHAFLVEKSSNYIDATSYTNSAATRITFPLMNTDLSVATTIKVMLRNTGTTIMTQPDVYYFVNGVLGSHETPSITLNPGDSLEYSFTTPASLVQGTGYQITALVAAQGDQASSDDVATVFINATVSIADPVTENYTLYLFPNPSNGSFQLMAGGISEDAQLQVFDMTGKKVFNTVITQQELEAGKMFTNQFESGVYLVRLQTAKAVLYRKLVIEK